MGFFQYIESFFFLSLGITFILILLLVFHFRSRVNFLELKNDSLTRFCDIITDEIRVLKNMCSTNYNPFYNQTTQEIPIISSSANYNEESYNEESYNEEPKYMNGENGSSDCYWNNILFCNNTPNVSLNDIVFIHQSGMGKEPDELVDLVIEECISDYIPNHEKSVYNKIIVLDEDVLDNVEEIIPEIETKLEPELEPELEEIHIIKSENEPITSIEETVPLAKDTQPNTSYQKMNVQALRAYAISIGLCSDSSKYKKAELVKRLLEHDLENKK
jgi:hypothetical protein